MKKVEFELPIKNDLGWFVTTKHRPFHYLRANGEVLPYSDIDSVYFETEKEADMARLKYMGDKIMKKSDLKTGMIVELVNGEKRLVIANTLMGLSYGTGGIPMEHVNNDLTLSSALHPNIAKVYSEPNIGRPEHIGSDISWFEKADCTMYSTLLWKRQKPLELTVADIEEKFGCKVKIVLKKGA